MTDTRSLVDEYLKRLDRALRDVPPAGREEIVGDIREHIVEAAHRPVEDLSEAEIRTILDQIGDPETIAAEARDRFGVKRHQAGVLEAFAILLLLIGGFILPVVGWIVGAILLWLSKVWTTRDKIIGTLFVPGGLALPFFLSVFAVGVSSSCEVTADGSQICSNEVVGPGFLGNVLLALLVIAPIAAAIYLGRRAFRRP